MLDIKIIRENPDAVRESLRARNMPEAILDVFLAIDTEWLGLKIKVDGARQKLNEVSQARHIEEGKKAKEEANKLEEEIK